MKAITVRQPWAWAIVHGGKDVENRTWSTTHRGPLAIHAGKTWDPIGGPTSSRPPIPELAAELVDCGAVVAVADLVDICAWYSECADTDRGRCRCSPWAQWRRYHWRLANVRPLAEPVPCAGRLGLWTLPADVEATVAAQLADAPEGQR